MCTGAAKSVDQPKDIPLPTQAVHGSMGPPTFSSTEKHKYPGGKGRPKYVNGRLLVHGEWREGGSTHLPPLAPAPGFIYRAEGQFPRAIHSKLFRNAENGLRGGFGEVPLVGAQGCLLARLIEILVCLA